METVIYAYEPDQFPDDAEVYYDKVKGKWFVVVTIPDSTSTRYIAGMGTIKQILKNK